MQPVSERILAGGDQAVVYSLLAFRGGPRGQPHTLVRLITTLVWQREPSTWCLVIRQATRET